MLISLEPSYPTITPKTLCKNGKSWGDWYLTKNASVQKQNACINNRDFNKSLIDTDVYSPNYYSRRSLISVDDFNVQVENTGDNDVITKRNACFASVLNDFPNLNAFCKVPDGNVLTPLDASFLMQGCMNELSNASVFCETTKNTYKKNNIDFTVNNGWYFCGDDGIKPEKCAFNAGSFLEKQYENYLKDQCGNMVKVQRDKGLKNAYSQDDMSVCKSMGIISGINNDRMVHKIPMIKDKGYCTSITPDGLHTDRCSAYPIDPIDLNALEGPNPPRGT